MKDEKLESGSLERCQESCAYQARLAFDELDTALPSLFAGAGVFGPHLGDEVASYLLSYPSSRDEFYTTPDQAPPSPSRDAADLDQVKIPLAAILPLTFPGVLTSTDDEGTTEEWDRECFARQNFDSFPASEKVLTAPDLTQLARQQEDLLRMTKAFRAEYRNAAVPDSPRSICTCSAIADNNHLTIPGSKCTAHPMDVPKRTGELIAALRSLMHDWQTYTKHTAQLCVEKGFAGSDNGDVAGGSDPEEE